MFWCKVINKLFICFEVPVADFAEIGEMKGNRFLYQSYPENELCNIIYVLYPLGLMYEYLKYFLTYHKIRW